MTVAARAPSQYSQILEIENCPEIYGLRCAHTGIAVWSTMRNAVYRMIVGDFFYDTPLYSVGSASYARADRWRQVSTIARSFAHNALESGRHTGPFPVMVMPGGARLIKNSQGQWFNGLSDHFVLTQPAQHLVMEDVMNWRWPFPRQVSPVLLHTPYQIRAVVAGRLGKAPHVAAASAWMELVEQRALHLLGWEMSAARRAWLVQVAARALAALPGQVQAYEALLRRWKCRLIIKEEACYPSPANAALMVAARRQGVLTAEYQHGVITPNHDAYNFGTYFLNHAELHEVLPHYFLSYGTWWSQQINAPLKCVPIGNPHRTETLRDWQAVPTQDKNVLVLGDGVDTQGCLKFCADLAGALPTGMQVRFRPHPLERQAVMAMAQQGQIKGIAIDALTDIYQSFSQSYAVVGELSTGLFEATGLVEHVLMWATPKANFAFQDHPFQTVADAAQVAHQLAQCVSQTMQASPSDQLWAPHWQQNYQRFLDEVLT